MTKVSPVRVLYIRDNKKTADAVVGRLVERGFTVDVIGGRAPRAGVIDICDIICIDVEVLGPDTVRELHNRGRRGDAAPVILIAGSLSVENAGGINDLAPVCCLIRDDGGRYLDTLAGLVERLSAPGILAAEKRGLEQALHDAEERLFISQKNEAIGMLAGGLAHEFNNILATILGYASFLRGKATQGDIFSSGLSAIEDSAMRASELTAQIQFYAREGKSQARPLFINDVVGDIAKLIRKTFAKSVRIVLELDENIGRIEADTARIRHMILTLAIHVRDAMPGGGTLTIRTFTSDLPDGGAGKGAAMPPGDYVGLAISGVGEVPGDGAGRESHGVRLIREKTGGAAQTDLSAAYEIARQHGGRIDVGSESENELVVLLPVREATEEETAAVPVTVQGGTETILVVDDETQIVTMLRRLLTESGYRVLYSDSGAGGIRIFEQQGDRIDLVLLDVMMPGMGGREVMARILSLRPDAKILLFSGFSQQDRHRDLIDMGAAGFIGKPFMVHDLLAKIRDILG
jgi:two-component system cell cycle sensor histidine kinase/response regulator CckA